MKRFIRICALVVPWLLAVEAPVFRFEDFVFLPGFALMLIPMAPLILWRCLVIDPACSMALKAVLFSVGVIAPPVIALLLARFWNRRWFWFVWMFYLMLLAFDVLLTLLLLKVLV